MLGRCGRVPRRRRARATLAVEEVLNGHFRRPGVCAIDGPHRLPVALLAALALSHLFCDVRRLCLARLPLQRLPRRGQPGAGLFLTSALAPLHLRGVALGHKRHDRLLRRREPALLPPPLPLSAHLERDRLRDHPKSLRPLLKCRRGVRRAPGRHLRTHGVSVGTPHFRVAQRREVCRLRALGRRLPSLHAPPSHLEVYREVVTLHRKVGAHSHCLHAAELRLPNENVVQLVALPRLGVLPSRVAAALGLAEGRCRCEPLSLQELAELLAGRVHVSHAVGAERARRALGAVASVHANAGRRVSIDEGGENFPRALAARLHSQVVVESLPLPRTPAAARRVGAADCKRLAPLQRQPHRQHAAVAVEVHLLPAKLPGHARFRAEDDGDTVAPSFTAPFRFSMVDDEIPIRGFFHLDTIFGHAPRFLKRCDQDPPILHELNDFRQFQSCESSHVLTIKRHGRAASQV